MSRTAKVLAFIGGALLGGALGMVPGCSVGYYAFREMPPDSHKTHPGDYLGAFQDAGERVNVATENVGHAIAGAVAGTCVGSLLGIGVAAWAVKRPQKRSVPASQ